MARSSKMQAPAPVHWLRPGRQTDLVHLAKQCLGGEHREYEILRLLDTTSTTYFARLRAAETDADIRLNLHSIKGAASGVGAWTIADLAKAAEDDLAAGHPLSPELIADLDHAVQETSVFIAVMLSNERA